MTVNNCRRQKESLRAITEVSTTLFANVQFKQDWFTSNVRKNAAPVLQVSHMPHVDCAA
jgi:hypothetical protein